MDPNQSKKLFSEAIKIVVIWDKEQNSLIVTLENLSDRTFYCIQGEFILFNKMRRAIATIPSTYKYIKGFEKFTDDFKDIKVTIPVNTHTIVYRVISVECENIYITTSLEIKNKKDRRGKDIFSFTIDTDLIEPNNDYN